MLRYDRYLIAQARALDLASGHLVEIERTSSRRATHALFEARDGRTLIDIEPAPRGRIEVWERWIARGPATANARTREDAVASFVELLECARLGAPRAFDLTARRAAEREYLRRLFAREARVRGWIPLDLELLAVLTRRGCDQWPKWLDDRSLVVFVETPGLSGAAVLALLHLSRRDQRPHVLVRAMADQTVTRWPFLIRRIDRPTVHEAVSRWPEPQAAGPGTIAPSPTAVGPPRVRSSLSAEAAARWAVMLQEITDGSDRAARTLDLADVLTARGQPFEAGALLARVPESDAALAGRRRETLARLAEHATARAAAGLSGRPGKDAVARGWEMVDDFVGVLQLCQDNEDEHTALSRVGAYLRERLQASTVAFVARESAGTHVLSRVGSEAATIELALRSIDTGTAIPAAHGEGPVESAYPVRHATEVIGAVWCRWSAGMPVASQQASTLLGIAAAAAAPSVRLAIARRHPVVPAATLVPELVGQSPAMATVREAIVRAAASPFPVVIEGESGSGKELAARAIHARSVRREKRFCPINCAALVDDLVEAELFGHTRGAFTGATTDRPGVFEDASGGTLFLDEVAELGPRVQAKLLRTLQEGEVRRLGESLVRRVDVRMVAATNRPLAREVEAARFREDLWYRLDVVRISLPPLRARLEDLAPLARHIWQTLAGRTGSRAVLSPATVAALCLYDWPGNVRELQNVLASLQVSAPRTGLIGPAALPGHIARAAAFERTVTLDAARRQFEERYVRAALARAGGRQSLAARELGLTRQGFTKLLGRLGIPRTKN